MYTLEHNSNGSEYVISFFFFKGLRIILSPTFFVAVLNSSSNFSRSHFGHVIFPSLMTIKCLHFGQIFNPVVIFSIILFSFISFHLNRYIILVQTNLLLYSLCHLESFDIEMEPFLIY